MMISMWAYTATIRAARSDMDIVGCLVVACAACLGGGTFRDAFLGRAYFWVADPSFLTNILVSSFATFIAWPFMERSGAQKGKFDNINFHYKSYVVTTSLSHVLPLSYVCLGWYLVPDAIGMLYFTVVGTHIASMAGAPFIVTLLSGLCTGCFGGVAQDLLCQRKIRILSSGGRLYTVPAVLTSLVYALWSRYQPEHIRTGGAVALGLGLMLRLAALHWDLKLPVWLNSHAKSKGYRNEWIMPWEKKQEPQEPLFDWDGDAPAASQ